MNRIRPELFGVSNRKRTVKRIHRESRSGAYLPLPRDCQLVGGHGRAAIQLLFLRRAVSNSCSNSPLPPAGRRRVTSRGRGSTTGSCWECSAMNGATGCQDSSRRVSASVYLGGRPTTQWLLTTNCRQSCSCSTPCICFFNAEEQKSKYIGRFSSARSSWPHPLIFLSLLISLVTSLVHLAPASEHARSPAATGHGRPHSIPYLSSGGDGHGQSAPSPASAPAAVRHLLQAPAASASVRSGGAPRGCGGRAGLRATTGSSGWPTSICNGKRSRVAVWLRLLSLLRGRRRSERGRPTSSYR
jgi:hypothetical protein